MSRLRPEEPRLVPTPDERQVRPDERVRAQGRPAPGDRRADGRDRAGRQAPGPARRHRQREDLHDRVGHRARPPARRSSSPTTRPWRPSSTRSSRRFFPQNAVEYFVSLLRLLPARGLRPAVRHLHRQGGDDQRRDRPPAPLGDAAASSSAATSSSSRRSRASTASARRRPTTACSLLVRQGEELDRHDLLAKLVDDPVRPERRRPSSAGPSASGATSSRSCPAYEESGIRIELFGDEIEAIASVDPLTGRTLGRLDAGGDLPLAATTSRRARGSATPSKTIEAELLERKALLEREGRLLEAQRLEQRTLFDLEMLREVGLLPRHRELLAPPLRTGARASRRRRSSTTFPQDALVVIDESHQTRPAGPRDVPRRPARKADARRVRLPAARRRSTTGRSASRSSRRGWARSSSCRRRPARTSSRRPAGPSSSRSSGRRA